jgi:hypothetical protein
VAELTETEGADFAYGPTDAEMSVAAHIADCPNGNFDAVLADDARFDVFFHLSPMRESILNWYPFDPEGVVLELGGDMGAVTGLLCERCARVVTAERKAFKAKAIADRHGGRDNLVVVNGDAARLLGSAGLPSVRGLPQSFDFIVCIAAPNSEGFGPEFLSGLFKLLSPRGKLLLAAENRFALRYWCGKRSPATIAPFDGLRGYGRLVSKAELSRRLSRAGFAGQKWYYPMTDHWFAREIYSEACLPNRFLNSRFVPYCKSDDALLLREQGLYEDVIAGGAFEFMCNAYLVEARKGADDVPCDADYAALTTYRTADKSFATTLHADGTARKTALRPEGMRYLENLAKNHAALAERGISVVPVTLSGNAAVMPRSPHVTLWDHWKENLRAGRFDADAFINEFDRLRDIIAASSDSEAPGTHGWDPSLGPVQKTAYPELVPANCFYDTESGALTFFDQEYAREHCPASVPLSRALLCLRSALALSSDERAPDLMPLLIARYGLTEAWRLLEDIDADFWRFVFNPEATGVLDRETAKAGEIVRQNEIKARYGRIASLIRERWKRIGVYGFGQRGRHLCAYLPAVGTEIAFLIDRNAEIAEKDGAGLLNLKIYESLARLPEDAVCDAIVVTPKEEAGAIAAELREKANCPVVTLEEIMDYCDE